MPRTAPTQSFQRESTLTATCETRAEDDAPIQDGDSRDVVNRGLSEPTGPISAMVWALAERPFLILVAILMAVAVCPNASCFWVNNRIVAASQSSAQSIVSNGVALPGLKQEGTPLRQKF